MKNILLLLGLALLSSGCSKTWTGVKQDTYEMVTNTKEVLHEATAPDDVPASQAPSAPVQSAAPVATVNPATDTTHQVQTVEPVIPSMTN